MTGEDGNDRRPDAAGSPCSPGVLTEEQALQLIAFLTSAAEISIHEPTYYGTFRLVDAASRMIALMLEHATAPQRRFLRDLKTEIDTKKVWTKWDRDADFDFLRATPARWPPR